MKKEVADFKISIKRSTKKRLIKRGKMGETYDALINRLLDTLEIGEKKDPLDLYK